MIRQISVSNLGCFDDQEYKVDFSEETLLAGPNNSGKSMLINAMNILREYSVAGLQWTTPYYNLWSFDAAVNNHKPNTKIKMSMTIKGDTVDLLIGGGRVERAVVNNTVFNTGSAPVVKLMKRIWCFSPNRSLVPYQSAVRPTEDPLQPLRPNGSNVNNFLLERWTDRDENWDFAESWLKKIDPDMSQLKTPIRGDQVSLETLLGDTNVNVSLQGSGFQSAAAIVSAIAFSPEGSTIVLEEPEAFLHRSSQEVILDMINDAVNNRSKQVIFSTHSQNMLLRLYGDVGLDGASRGSEHVAADPEKFRMWTFEKVSGKVSIEPYPIQNKTFQQFKDDFKIIWG
jgi:energy-coupling factor transporter ATP-binding protein EcfA2